MAKDSTDEESKEKYEFSFEQIKALGGNEDDFKLIANIDDDAKEIEFGDDEGDYDENLTKEELAEFAKRLKFFKLPKDVHVVDDDDVQQTTKKPTKDDRKKKKEKKVKVKKRKVDGSEQTSQSDEIVAENTEPVLKKKVNPLIGPPTSHVFRKSMLVPPIRKWFESEIAVIAPGDNELDITPAKLSEFETYAKKLLDWDVELYQKYKESANNRSNFNWIHTVQKSGTAADKMAAYTVLLQDSSVHNLTTLDSLISLVDGKHRNECLMAIDTLKELFLDDLLLENKKLHTFDQHPFGSLVQILETSRESYDKLLLFWYFESLLKKSYIQFVLALCKMCRDQIETAKRKALNTIYELLSRNPEQEKMLLTALVNKIGDIQPKVASSTCMLLCRLLDKHPNMKTVVVEEVERFLFRRNLDPKALYCAVCFLTQIILDIEDKEVAVKLFSIYFSLFKASINKDDANSKMLKALLTGVNRAFPFARLDASFIEDQFTTLYAMVQVAPFNVGLRALMLLFQMIDTSNEFADRFYRALYRKLLDSKLKHTSLQAMFLNLLYKSLKREKTPERISAFVKRILQIISEQSPAMTCGLLFIISEVSQRTSYKLVLRHQGASVKGIDDDDGDEKYEDVAEESDSNNHKVNYRNDRGEKLTLKDDAISTKNHQGASSSWIHHRNLHVSQGSDDSQYDILARNPLYAKAENACLWELIELSKHFHPAVALFAQTILSGQRISYSGDPLQDFTLTRFLNRFVYRNPKKISDDTATSQRKILGIRKYYVRPGVAAMAVNSSDFIIQPQNRVPVEEQFFYNYFVNRQKMNVKQKLDSHPNEDVESVQSEEFEELLDRIETDFGKDEYDLDFAKEFKSQSKAKKEKKKGEEEEDEIDVDDDDDYVDFGEDKEFADAFKDYDEDIKAATAENGPDEEENFEFMNYDDDNFADGGSDDMDAEMSRSKKRQVDEESLFAAAEEFSAILDKNTTDFDTSGLEALSNRDNAHIKQLNWEQDRDRWIRGADWKSRKRNKQDPRKRNKQDPRKRNKQDPRKRGKLNTGNKKFKNGRSQSNFPQRKKKPKFRK